MVWAPSYVTATEVLTYLKARGDVEDASTFAPIWAEAASRAVDDFCGRQFGLTSGTEARTYHACWDRYLRCYLAEVDDLPAATATVADSAGAAVTVTEYGPANAVVKGKVFTHLILPIGGKVTVTAQWGWSAVPASVKQATLIQASRFAARRDSPFGVAGSPAEGSEVLLRATLDPDLKTSLTGRYRRTAWAA